MTKKTKIVSGIFWVLAIITFGLAMLNYGFGTKVLWYFTGLAYLISNLYLLYHSLDYVESNKNTSMGIVGLVVSALCLLVIVAVVVMIVVIVIKGMQQG